MKKRIFSVGLVAFLVLSVFLAGCTGQANNKELTVEELCPLDEGNSWVYSGEGMEYADFSQKVLYKEANRIQVEQTNSGSVVGIIYEYQDGNLAVVYSQEESYDGENILDKENQMNEVILKAPFEVGNTWQAQGQDFEIVAIDELVKTPAGEFKDCLKIVSKSGEDNYENRSYYKPGLGLVKQEFIMGDSEIISELESFEVSTFKENK